MRVITGKYRGKVLTSPKNDSVRPTPDKVKEAVFNILGASVDGAAWLEPFGGAGGMAVEALSRGAARAVLIDAAKESFRLIKENLAKVGAENGEVLYGDAAVVMRRLAADGERFDLIYLDPPYASGLDQKILDLDATASLLKERGKIIAEHESKDLRIPKGFAVESERRYGRVRITIIVKEETS